MSELPTKTYPPSFLRAMIADHLGDANKNAAATTEESSAVQTKGDAMSETEVFYLWDGTWVRHEDHVEEVERLKAEIKRLKAERDAVVQDEKRLRVLIDHARQDEARWVSWLSRAEEGGRDE